MKKIVLTLSGFLLTIAVWGQNLSEAASKNLSNAQKATLELTKTYNLSNQQIAEVKRIEEAKFTALTKLETLKSKDFKKYIAKRISTFETADNSLMAILDEPQLQIFKKMQIAKSAKYEDIVAGMKKQGYSQSDIDKKLAETEF